ncbi:hypothetical protein NDU88_003124 [Pleurodeles waltl]|uniref:Uncharacterized protein n=2 Tax=Pleurodeles waltl TaxID=8319 RepID=A0AAV7VFQ6_PLEWA|nr:hypothetical protein NDU88_003124 [Pleurodeles waltl]
MAAALCRQSPSTVVSASKQERTVECSYTLAMKPLLSPHMSEQTNRMIVVPSPESNGATRAKPAFEASLNNTTAALNAPDIQTIEEKALQGLRISPTLIHVSPKLIHVSPKLIHESKTNVNSSIISASVHKVVNNHELSSHQMCTIVSPSEEKPLSKTKDNTSSGKQMHSKVVQPAVDSLCSCQQKGETSEDQKETETPRVDIFHLSPTDDERLHAKVCSAKSYQPQSVKDSTAKAQKLVSVELSQKATTESNPTLNKQNDKSTNKVDEMKPENNLKSKKIVANTVHSQSANISSSKFTRDNPKISVQPGSKTNTLKSSGGPTKNTANALDVIQKESEPSVKGKPQKAPFRLKKLFSATFPLRMKKETDERQVQLQKVKQYELELLEELLKPKTKADIKPKEYLLPSVPGRCACQVRSSPVQKVPGMSREQRRSCDCKRICRGMMIPTSQITVPDVEKRGRPKTTFAQRQAELAKVLNNSSPTKSNQIRSTSLESRECKSDPENSVSCLTTCTSQGDCMSAPHYKKLLRRYSVSEIDKSDAVSLSSDIYQNIFPTKQKALKNEDEQITQSSSSKSQALQSAEKGGNSHAQLEEDKKGKKVTGVVAVKEEMYPSQTKLPDEEADNKKCCSIRYCFYYRKCDTADDGSDKDELSYSIPMQILPGMKLDNQMVPVMSRTLQVLDATACSSSEDSQTQEIDLRTSTFEGSLAKISLLRGHVYALPDGFVAVQLDTSELLTIIRQCVVSSETRDSKPYMSQLTEYKQELALKFKEFRASCRRLAAVDKSPTHMLSAITSSFQVLCSLIETFVRLVYIVRSESQRQELLRKVEEVVRNYTFLLRAAEESTARTLNQQRTIGQLARQSAAVATVMSTFSRSIKTLINK